MLKTAGLIYVSYPVISGKIVDKSTSFLINQLSGLNYEVEQVSLLCPKQNRIADELLRLSKCFDIILVITDLTSDIVLKALAEISNEQDCVKNNSNVLCYEHKFPFSSKFLGTRDMKYPVVYFSRIFILGEDLLVQHFNLIKPYLEQYRQEVVYRIIIEAQLNGNSKTVLEKLNKYPIQIEKKDKCVKFTLENSNFEDVVTAQQMLNEVLSDRGMHVYGGSRIFNNIFQEEDDHLQKAISDIKECLAKYGPQNIFLSFNGGKDCTVLLHLTYMVMKNTYPNYNRSIFCLYVRSQNSFVEQDKFIEQCKMFYNLDILDVEMDMKEALKAVLVKMPHLKACLMGTRRTDPYSQSLHVYEMTDPDWPTVMRVNPLLDWTYCDIWDYLLLYKVPYCKLYDQGYTSLGSTNNTIRNLNLLYHDIETGSDRYLPAYKLLDKSKERDGRNVRKS